MSHYSKGTDMRYELIERGMIISESFLVTAIEGEEE
jgi:hypothetical protein